MAHEPECKAAAVADLAGGMTTTKVAKKHKVPIATVVRWHSEMSTNGSIVPSEARRERFETALLNFFEATMGMLTAQAELLSDEEYIRKQPADDIIRHTEFISSQSSRFVELARGVPGSGAAVARAAQPAALPDVVEPDGD